MKSLKIALTILCLLNPFINHSFAQDWAILGNGGTNPVLNFVGTTDNNELFFRTNNFRRFLIDNGGTLNTEGRVAFANDILPAFVPQARIHAFQFSALGHANADMFRTDGSNTVDNNWRIFTGPTQAASTEKFRLYVPASFGGNNVTMQTTQNGKMFFATNSVLRTQINHNVNYAIAGLAGVRNGFFLLTNNPTATAFPAASGGAPTLLMNNPNYGPYSLLHLMGDDSPNIQDGGYRNWMRNGITMTNNFDMGFIGVRPMPDPVGTTGTDDVSDFPAPRGVMTHGYELH